MAWARLVVVATNNPDALFGSSMDFMTYHSPCKYVSICANEELTRGWESRLCAALVQAIQAHIPRAASCALNVLRLGFDTKDEGHNPIVIHLTFDADDFSFPNEAAGQLLVALETLVHAHWKASESGEGGISSSSSNEQ